MYECPIKPIDVSSLFNELTSLNKVIEKFDVNNVSKKLEYVLTLKNSIGGVMQHKNKQRLRTRKIKHPSLEKLEGKGWKKQKTRKRRIY